LSYRQGTIWSARFAPDGQTIVYSAAWEGKPTETFSTRPDSTEARSLGLTDASILSISSTGEMAVMLKPRFIGYPIMGTLARVPLAGGAPREVAENVLYADWSPDGKSLAVVRGGGDKWRLEYPIGKVLYETDAWISYPRISPKGDTIAFFDQPVRYDNRGSVAVVDLAGNKKTIFSGAVGLWGLAWAGDEIWFSGIVGGDLGIFAATLAGRERLLSRFPSVVVLHDISRDGRILMTRENARTGIIGLAPGETKERDLSWFDGSFARDISVDGKTLVCEEAGEAGGSTALVYMRKTDGSPAVQLGDGNAIALSLDGKWVLASHRYTTPLQLAVLPTGVGEPKLLPSGAINYREVAAWFPDSKRVLFVGSEPGHDARCYVWSIDGGAARAITPEGITAGGLTSPEGIAASWITPDGKYVIAGKKDQTLSLYPVDGGEPLPISGLAVGDVPIRWTANGRSLYLFRLEEVPAKVYRLDLATGHKQLWKELVPADPAGISIIYTIQMTPDAKSYVYTYLRELSDLYVVDGLK
jgi:Tol biopolymer transport system component